MSKKAGRRLPLSPLRRLVGDHQHFCGKVPAATVERPLSLAELRAARQECVPRPSWCAIFLKAMSMVGARHPPFRRAFLPFPWPHLYEHPDNIANFTIERRYQDEDVVFLVQVRRPERRSLTELDAIIHTCKEEPVESVKFFRRAIRLSKVPWPFRRLAWWGSLNLSGKLRAHNFGTFSLTSTSSEGAGILTLLPLVTSTLHYGLFDDRGNLPVRITFDHRVLDGAFVARGLVELEEVLQTTILEELLNTRALKRDSLQGPHGRTWAYGRIPETSRVAWFCSP
jgi:hypothetical protein